VAASPGRNSAFPGGRGLRWVGERGGLLLADACGEKGKSLGDGPELGLDPRDQPRGKQPAGPGRQCPYQAHQDEGEALGRAEGGG
jgi:hypothetical protein